MHDIQKQVATLTTVMGICALLAAIPINGFSQTADGCLDSPPVNDGWGWDGIQSCRIAITGPGVCIDSPPLNDGWGWNGVESCRINGPEIVGGTCVDSEPVGDGWGWNGVQSCRIEVMQPRGSVERLVNSNSYKPNGIAVSSGNRFVLFSTFDPVFKNDDTNGFSNVYIRDTQDQSIQKISVAQGFQNPGNHSYVEAISSDGRYSLFNSYVRNLTTDTTNGSNHLHRFDLQTGENVLVSVDSSGAQGRGNSYGAMMSDDGTVIAFTSDAPNLDGLDTNGRSDVYMRNMNSKQTKRISVGPNGQSNGRSTLLDVSADGRYILFDSSANNLDASRSAGLFLYDIATDTLINHSNRRVASAAISNYGRYIISIDSRKLYWFDRTEGRGEQVNFSTNPNTNGSLSADISADGRYVIFDSDEGTLTSPPANTNGVSNIFLADMFAGGNGTKTLLTQTIDQQPASADSSNARFTADNKFVYFSSAASNLVANDTNGRFDDFITPLYPGL